MTERWLRWYDGTVRDGKFRIAADMSEVPVCTVIGVWASLLEDAATSSPRGCATKGINHHSMFLDIAESALGTVWNALERVGLIRTNTGNGGGVLIVNWDRRQFETDARDPTAKARKEKWKQRHKKHRTKQNAAERSGTPETETETETETEIYAERAKRAACMMPPDFIVDLNFAVSKGFSEERAQAEAERFRNHALEKGRKCKNWEAAWRNWVTSPFQQNGVSNGQAKPQRQSLGDRARELAKQARELENSEDFRRTHEPAGSH